MNAFDKKAAELFAARAARLEMFTITVARHLAHFDHRGLPLEERKRRVLEDLKKEQERALEEARADLDKLFTPPSKPEKPRRDYATDTRDTDDAWNCGVANTR